MTSEDILLVQKSWRALKPVRQITAELFYVKLSELDPGLRLLFDDDLVESNRKFVKLVDATVKGLKHTDVLIPAVREVGLRNPTFGLTDKHHGTVAAALLWSLEKGLRSDFTADVKAAWARIFGELSLELRAEVGAR